MTKVNTMERCISESGRRYLETVATQISPDMSPWDALLIVRNEIAGLNECHCPGEEEDGCASDKCFDEMFEDLRINSKNAKYVRAAVLTLQSENLIDPMTSAMIVNNRKIREHMREKPHKWKPGRGPMGMEAIDIRNI